MKSDTPSYHGYRSPPEIISYTVWLYHRFCMSFRGSTRHHGSSSVQSRRDRRAAKRFFRKLLKGQGSVPRRLFTDKLRSYPAALRSVMPSVIHSTTPSYIINTVTNGPHLRNPPRPHRRHQGLNRNNLRSMQIKFDRWKTDATSGR